MARKRFITPDIWSDSFFVKLSPQERLLFIGMITLADDEGRLRAEPSYLKGEIFPKDWMSEGKTRQLRDRIAALNRSVQLYKVEGMEYVQLRNWPRYQRPSHPLPSRLPPPRGYKILPQSAREPHEDGTNDAREPHDLGMGVGRGMGLGKGSGSNPPISPPKGGRRRRKNPGDPLSKYRHLIKQRQEEYAKEQGWCTDGKCGVCVICKEAP